MRPHWEDAEAVDYFKSEVETLERQILAEERIEYRGTITASMLYDH